MATVRLARIEGIDTVGADTRVLHVVSEEPLGFVGGQYVIVDSGLRREDGKAVKRAYSVLSGDDDQHRFSLAVKRLPGAPGSSFMHDLRPDAALRFSGPWGKLVPSADARGSALVVATDTGVTAALGLLRGRRFAPLLAGTSFIWLRESPEYFLPDGLVRDFLPAGLRSVQIGALPAVADPVRVPAARIIVGAALSRERPVHVFAAGDGAVNYALLEDLSAAGVQATRDNLESFFNMPKKSA
jgi:ferredoxin-NADP reductase